MPKQSESTPGQSLGPESPVSNLWQLLERAATCWGDAPFAAADDSENALSFNQLSRLAEQTAARLVSDLGIRPGEHVGILLPNCLEFLPVYFGIHRAGAIAVPFNIRLKPAELSYILADSDIKALFVHRRTGQLARDSLGHPSELPLVDVSGESGAWFNAEAPAPPIPTSSLDDVAAIIYTSGTTGRPKGAMLTHGNILFNVEATKAAHGLRPDDTHLLVVPLFHVTGLNTILPTALDQGARVVLSTQVDPLKLTASIQRIGCTTFFGVPTTFYLLTNRESIVAPPSLRMICYSGAPMSPVTISRLRDAFPGVELHNFFGLTETTSVSTVLPDDQALSRAESVGVPPPGLELSILDEDDRPLPSGQIGELAIRGPSIFEGYWQRPEATAEALRGGWFHTGDAAVLDDEGYLYLRGRLKEMIIVAGENVYPIEVENALCSHTAVQEAAVFGRPDSVLGEVVHAAVVLRPGAVASERDLKAHLNDRLASFKMPRAISFLESLPRNPSGKVVKRELL